MMPDGRSAARVPGLPPEKDEGPALTVGQKEFDKKAAGDLWEWMSAGRSDVSKMRVQLNETLGDLETHDDVTGPIVGNLPEFVNEWVNPRSIKARENVEEVVQRNLRAVLGAQFTEKEGDRLIARAYNPRLDEATNKARVTRLLNQIEQAAKVKDAAAKYFMENGTLAGWDGVLPTWSSFNPDGDASVSSGEKKPIIDALLKKYGN